MTVLTRYLCIGNYNVGILRVKRFRDFRTSTLNPTDGVFNFNKKLFFSFAAVLIYSNLFFLFSKRTREGQCTFNTSKIKIVKRITTFKAWRNFKTSFRYKKKMFNLTDFNLLRNFVGNKCKRSQFLCIKPCCL